MKKSRFLLSLAALLMLTALGWAVDQTGSLSGAVMEEGGAGLPGVKVTVAGPSLMGTRSAVTDANGHFRLGNLSVGGNFTVAFALEGFQPVERKNVRIELGKDTYLSQMLTLGQIREAVVVTGTVPVLDPKSSTVQLNISKEAVEKLANDRQYQSVMEMMPGAIPGNNPAMMGASDSSNIYQFDGMEATDPLTKTWSTAQNFDNFEEMQVVATGAPAEYGRGTGAVINVVTKSGSNQLHGTARLSVSQSKWNSKEKDYNVSFSDATRYLNETRPSLNLGGPIVKDHLWFFASWERRNKWKPATWYTNYNEALALAPTGSGRGYYKGHYASAKLTAHLGNYSFMAQWNEDPIVMPQYYRYANSPGYADANECEKTQGGWNFSSEATATLGSNSYLTARFSMKRTDLGLESYTQTGIRYERNGYYWGAGNYHYQTSRDHNQYEVTLNQFIDSAFGYHDIKFGAEVYNLSISAPIGNNMYYPGLERIIYNSRGQTQQRRVYQAQPENANEYNDNVTFFLQDKWEVVKGLTLNLGLRSEQGKWMNHDRATVLKFDFTQQLAPRLGLAWSFGDNKVTANWGRFYDMYRWYIVDNFQPDVFSRSYELYYGEQFGYSNWRYMGTFWTTAPASSSSKSDDIHAPFMDEWSLGYERLLGRNLAVSASVMHRSWANKIEDYDPEGDGSYYFANATDYSDGTKVWGKTYRKYQALILSVKKNLGDDKFQFLASYTWAKLKGFNDSESESRWGDTPYSGFNAFGYLPNDTRHQIRFYGSYILPLDIVVGANFYWFGGQPIRDSSDYPTYAYMEYEDGGQTYFDGTSIYTWLAAPGSEGRLPPQSRLDLRVEKKFEFKKLFSVSVYADIFNVLNRQSALYQDTYLGEGHFVGTPGPRAAYVMDNPNPTYGQATAWTAPRSFFFGAKIEW